jgi:hypothetical protein
MLGAQGLWAEGNFYRATPAMTRAFVFPVSPEGLPHSVVPGDKGRSIIYSNPDPHGSLEFSHRLQHTRGCWGPILTRIFTGQQCLEFYIYIHRVLSPIFLLKLTIFVDIVFIWNYKMHACCKTSLIRFFSTKACLIYKYWFLLCVVLHCSITTLEAGFNIFGCSIKVKIRCMPKDVVFKY